MDAHRLGRLVLIPVLVLGTIVVTNSPTPPAKANHNQNAFNHPWGPPFPIVQHFVQGFPTGAMRTRVQNGFAVWTNRGQTMRYGLGADYPSFTGLDACARPERSGSIVWGFIDGGIPGFDRWAENYSCWYLSTLMMRSTITRFDSGNTWYTGTGQPPACNVRQICQPDAWGLGVHESGHAAGGVYEVGGDGGHWTGSAPWCAQGAGQHTMCPLLYGGQTWYRTTEFHENTAFDARY